MASTSKRDLLVLCILGATVPRIFRATGPVGDFRAPQWRWPPGPARLERRPTIAIREFPVPARPSVHNPATLALSKCPRRSDECRLRDTWPRSLVPDRVPNLRRVND